MPLMEILDLDVAKEHLRIYHDAWDDDIQRKLDQAHGIIADYIDRTDTDWAAEIESWDDETAPPQVIAAVLDQLAELWRFRGDSLEGEAPKREHGYLAPSIVAKLHRTRRPVVQ